MHCDEYAENEKKIVLQYMEYSKYQESKLEYKMIHMDSQYNFIKFKDEPRHTMIIFNKNILK